MGDRAAKVKLNPARTRFHTQRQGLDVKPA